MRCCSLPSGRALLTGYSPKRSEASTSADRTKEADSSPHHGAATTTTQPGPQGRWPARATPGADLSPSCQGDTACHARVQQPVLTGTSICLQPAASTVSCSMRSEMPLKSVWPGGRLAKCKLKRRLSSLSVSTNCL